MNKVGMIWNLIEVETFGVLTFWSFNPAKPGETKQIAKLDFEQRISKLLQDKHSTVFIVCTDDGELQIIPKEAINEKRELLNNVKSALRIIAFPDEAICGPSLRNGVAC